MYNSTDKSYKQARAIKTGEYKLALVYQEFVDFAAKVCSTSVLDFVCETKETSKGYKQQVVGLVIERVEEEKRLRHNAAIDQVIAQRFIAFLSLTPESVRKVDPLKKDVWPITLNPYPEILVTYYSLENIEKNIAETKAKEEWQKALAKHPQFWTLSQDVVFLQTDGQLIESNSNGFREKLFNEYLQILKKYDEFGYLGAHSISFRFDSKENFDREYDGNWYYYWK